MEIFMLSEGGRGRGYPLPLDSNSSDPKPPKKDDDSWIALIVLFVIAFLLGMWFKTVVSL